jgi:hypothetical protein
MNANSRQFLNALAAALLLAASSAPALASDSTLRTLSSFDCAKRSLPSLGTVGSWYGTNNAGRAYALRSQLMTAVTRACHRSGNGRVDVVVREPASSPDLVAKSSGH